MTTIDMARTPTSRQLLALLLILFAGCGNMPEQDVKQVSSADLYAQAKSQESRGNLLGAAQNYQQLAQRNASPAREGHLLEAANLLSRNRNNDRAKALIATLDTKQLTTDQNLRLRLIQARIAMDEKQPRVALEQLQPTSKIALPADIQQEWLRLLGDANTLTGNPLGAAHAWVMLEKLLHDELNIEKNQQQIWAALNQYQESTLRNLRKQPPPDILSGWIELTVVAKAAVNQPSQLSQQLAQWRSRYPNHPARESLITGLRSSSQAAFDKLPDNIALLLPLSGSFSSQAVAVRDGFLAAYYARSSGDYNPTIRIYDTTDNVDSGMASYRQALAEGADFIVGPLHKPLLEQISSSDKFTVPTLALNYLNDENVALNNLYQFGLLPEDEARQVAERARQDGRTNALVLIPAGEWGERMLATFSQEWQRLGGELLEVQRYDASQHDFAEPVVNLLNIDINFNNGRYNIPKGANLQRRQDADFVFVAAFPNQARQIRSQLRFYFAADLPVYSTSHTFSGEINANQDRDLDGVLFCDMPWTLTNGEGHTPNWEAFTNIWHASAVPFKRLYAMGIDAYNLMEQYNALGNTPQNSLSGESGNLYRDAANRIHRQLQWARFRNGQPVLLEESTIASPGPL
ncbi:MAG: penicillin-binding protein activator [Pseudomonadota bacterium]|nr:penicillin-binding protein activator [Pseudomonadota bacterium]